MSRASTRAGQGERKKKAEKGRSPWNFGVAGGGGASKAHDILFPPDDAPLGVPLLATALAAATSITPSGSSPHSPISDKCSSANARLGVVVGCFSHVGGRPYQEDRVVASAACGGDER
jgi:hypothetical protein